MIPIRAFARLFGIIPYWHLSRYCYANFFFCFLSMFRVSFVFSRKSFGNIPDRMLAGVGPIDFGVSVLSSLLMVGSRDGSR